MRRGLLPLLFLAAACGRPRGGVAAFIDTLPGGVIRVQNHGPSGWQDTAQITFTEVQRIQPADGAPGELGNIMDVVMDRAGRIYVAEQGPTRIDRFGPDGSFEGSVGREGGGPGEYEATMLANVGGQLVVHDPQQRRTSVFDSAGKFVRGWPSSCCMWRSIGADTTGNVYVPVPPSGGVMSDQGPGWIRFRLDGSVSDTLWRRSEPDKNRYWTFTSGPGNVTRFNIPFQPSLVDIPWPGGGLLIGDQATYSITIAPHGGDSAVVFGRTWTPRAIPDSIREHTLSTWTSRNERLKAVARVEDIPTTYPAFNGMVVDADLRVWVQRSNPDPAGGSFWDLFAPTGIWLGTVHAPFHTGRVVFRRGEVLVVTTDANDLPVLLRYKLTERGGRERDGGVTLGSE
ncbi:MAG TPA: hypothetical protein VFI13_04580 [Gemmatimonadales bacterium]|nr:hypothetical protein [Gemmatimonadales bacterium]